MIKEIYRNENLVIEGTTFYREAVRGIIIKSNQLLLVYSEVNGDYKFPGGGIEANESNEQALKRELLEEAGITSFNILKEYGYIMEYGEGMTEDIFIMKSSYYICEVMESIDELNLDQYERDLKFKPVWIDMKEALRINKYLINNKNNQKWTVRDTYIIEQVIDEYYDKNK